MADPLTILNVSGPYREPGDPIFSYDYSIQRPNWATPNGVRVKVSILEELDFLKNHLLGISGGSPGQQLILTRTLSRHIADRKLHIANEVGMLSARFDVLVGPFTGELIHLFPKLEAWMKDSQDMLRREVQEKAGI